mmetsp:Transcript_43749/g.68487  ORF Transcript_43749/g.68487 Transcript_43749/m.68487 type:complete len:151 (+) Transcript_43749:517-969(+)
MTRNGPGEWNRGSEVKSQPDVPKQVSLPAKLSEIDEGQNAPPLLPNDHGEASADGNKPANASRPEGSDPAQINGSSEENQGRRRAGRKQARAERQGNGDELPPIKNPPTVTDNNELEPARKEASATGAGGSRRRRRRSNSVHPQGESPDS